MSINRAILLGHVGRDPTVRRTNNGEEVASFSLATTESYRDKASGDRKDVTEWHQVVCWNQAIVKTIRDYVQKGGKVGVEGQIKTRKWTDKDGNDKYSTEIVIGRFDGRLTLEGQPTSQRSEADYGSIRTREPAAGRQDASQQPVGPIGGEIDDDIPF